MEAIAPNPKTKPQSSESPFTLRKVSWATYKALMADVGDSRPWRIAYETGVLELRMPLFQHEVPKGLLESRAARLKKTL